VAEGIQSAEQDAELRRLGCDYGQGYFYAAGMPARELDEVLTYQRALEVLAGAGSEAARSESAQGDDRPDAAETMATVAEAIASAARCRRPGGHPTSGAGLHDAHDAPAEPTGPVTRSRRSA
jgi:hypothetical protein